MHVRILQPAKTAMQSGRAKTQCWLIEPELPTARMPEPLMGWTASADTMIELLGKLKFDSAEKAVSFAREKGWTYTVQPAHKRTVTPKNYLDNFVYEPHDKKA